MEIVFHVGAHFTDEDQIARVLLKNRAKLAEQGIIVPWARQYRFLFRDLLSRLGGQRASPEMQDMLLDALMAEDEPERVVLLHDEFLSYLPDAVAEGRLYPGGAARLAALRHIFPEIPVSFCLATRNPATFLAAWRAAAGSDVAVPDVRELRWSDLVAEVRDAVPDSPVTVWCHEDAPVVWPEILREISGHAEGTALTHLDEILMPLLTDEGFERLTAFLAERPPASPTARRRAVAAFLGRFPRPDALEVEVDLPGLTDELLEEVTAAYDKDLVRIAGMPGVRLLA